MELYQLFKQKLVNNARYSAKIFKNDFHNTPRNTEIKMIILTQYRVCKLNKTFQSCAVQIFGSCLTVRIQFTRGVITCSAARCATVCV
jgi:hypothetical protein